MQLSVELTMYPLQDEYLDIIRSTISQIGSYPELDVKTFPTATIVVGEYSRVMGMLQDVIAWGYEKHGKCVFVAKFLPGYEAR